MEIYNTQCMPTAFAWTLSSIYLSHWRKSPSGSFHWNLSVFFRMGLSESKKNVFVFPPTNLNYPNYKMRIECKTSKEEMRNNVSNSLEKKIYLCGKNAFRTLVIINLLPLNIQCLKIIESTQIMSRDFEIIIYISIRWIYVLYPTLSIVLDWQKWFLFENDIKDRVVIYKKR